jgi:hypothetical protein
MQSGNSNPTLGPTPCPTGTQVKATPTREDKAAAWDLITNIHETIQSTSRALQELRHGLGNLLRDVLEKIDADKLTLIEVLDESPSGVQDIMDGEFDDLTTEMLIECLDKLRSLIVSRAELTDRASDLRV